ncbi:MAG: hypothetical protein HW406_926 [Candidatus Brocadiaceae bacterium]|nr:hypothetical protein [Candidatus Brocadiaceae bacterium]
MYTRIICNKLQVTAKVFVKKAVHERSLRITIAAVPSW